MLYLLTLTGQHIALRILAAILPPSLARVALKSALRSLSIQPPSYLALRLVTLRQPLRLVTLRQPLRLSRLLAYSMVARLRPAQRQPLRPAQRQPLRLLI